MVNTVQKSQTSSGLTVFRAACFNPFSSLINGVKIPGTNFPTVTYKQTGSLIISSNASGEFDFVFMGDPLYTFYSNSTLSNNSATQLNTTNVYQSVSAGNLDALMKTYRVVNASFTIQNAQPPTSSIGQLIIAETPMGENFYPQSLMVSAAPNNTEVLPKICDVNLDPTNLVPVGIQNMQKAATLSMAELLENKYLCVTKPWNVTFAEFRTSQQSTSYGGGSKVGAYIKVSSSNLVEFVTDDEYDMFKGRTCFLLRGMNFTPSAKSIIVNYVIHLEGTPPVPTGAAQTYVPTSRDVAQKAQKANLASIVDTFSRMKLLNPVSVHAGRNAEYARIYT